jgi:hypothetical protein
MEIRAIVVPRFNKDDTEMGLIMKTDTVKAALWGQLAVP